MFILECGKFIPSGFAAALFGARYNRPATATVYEVCVPRANRTPSRQRQAAVVLDEPHFAAV